MPTPEVSTKSSRPTGYRAPPLFSLACPRDRPKYRDDLWSRLADVNYANARSEVETIFGNHRIFLVSINDVQAAPIPASLTSNMVLLKAAYDVVYPGRHPITVLSTSAYDITYFGPGSFHPGRGGC